MFKFLIAGHTKNFCDACFGLCKRSIKGKDVFTPKQLIACYNDSATCNRVVTTSKVVWYDWKSFLSQFFSGAVQNISSQHEFEFHRDQPGVVKYKELFDSPNWSKQNLLKPGVTANDVVNPSGNFRRLDEFIVPPEKYLLVNNVITRKQKCDITREQYLRDEVIGSWFIGDKKDLVEEYFQNGD